LLIPQNKKSKPFSCTHFWAYLSEIISQCIHVRRPVTRGCWSILHAGGLTTAMREYVLLQYTLQLYSTLPRYDLVS